MSHPAVFNLFEPLLVGGDLLALRCGQNSQVWTTVEYYPEAGVVRRVYKVTYTSTWDNHTYNGGVTGLTRSMRGVIE